MAPKKLFGTDGIRGSIHSENLSPENIVRLGRILGHIVNQERKDVSEANNCIAIGRDTRASGSYLEHAIIAGITASGVDCHLLGIVPTAAVAHYTRSLKTSLGVMISASHNPHHDNGIKLFDSFGFKISEIAETAIEQRYFNKTDPIEAISLVPGQLSFKDAVLEYVSSLRKALSPALSLEGLKVVLDCGHGAAYKIAPFAFKEFGCDLHLIGCSPNGANINREAGSEAPNTLKSEVINKKAHVGIAFDGDADRVIFVDERGELIDGDGILATIAIHQKRLGLLEKDTVVSTVMSSVALDRALNPHGINVVRCEVGDKYVARQMVEHGFSFGGENSGHLILFPHRTTGDGIFSALRFLAILHQSKKTASQLVNFFKPTPRLLKNIEVLDKVPLTSLVKTQTAIYEMNEDLKNNGRVMLRYSGTENKARLLVEAPTEHACKIIADEIARQFDSEIRSTY